MAHSIEPLLPFNITLATFLVPNLTTPLSTIDLITTCMCQLQMHDEDLANIRDNIVKSRLSAASSFERQFAHNIITSSFKPGDLVLVQNSVAKNMHL